jgi:hypothetical protein
MRRKKKELLFLKKKKQKNFCNFALGHETPTGQTNKSLFGSFSSEKEHLASFLLGEA